MYLQTTVPPTSEPVSVDDVKARLRLTTTADDQTIAGQITQAREFAEKVSRRSLAYKSYSGFLDRFPFPNEPIRMPVPPLIGVTAIKFYDSTLTQQTWDPADYWVAIAQAPALIVPIPGVIYPSTAYVPGSVEVDFTAGWGYPGAAAVGSTPAIPAGPALPPDWQRSIQDVAIWIYEHPGEPIPDTLVQIPKVYVF